MSSFGCSLEDDSRWSNDRSPVPPSDTVWLFEEMSSTPIQPTSSLESNQQRQIILHAFCKSANEHRCYTLSLATTLQIALLDLEYWANVANPHPSANRITRYLERLRSDLWAELLQYYGSFSSGFQPKATIPWAVRMNHFLGHSFFGRQEYLQKCDANGWVPYTHEDPSLYRKGQLSHRRSFTCLISSCFLIQTI